MYVRACVVADEHKYRGGIYAVADVLEYCEPAQRKRPWTESRLHSPHGQREVWVVYLQVMLVLEGDECRRLRRLVGRLHRHLLRVQLLPNRIQLLVEDDEA